MKKACSILILCLLAGSACAQFARPKGYATDLDLRNATNGLIHTDSTNGLATTNFVNTTVQNATNNFVSGGVTTNQLQSATNNALATATNSFMPIGTPIPTTNGFVTATITNGFIDALTGTNIAAALTNQLVIPTTNQFVSSSITNGMATTNFVNTATNNFGNTVAVTMTNALNSFTGSNITTWVGNNTTNGTIKFVTTGASGYVTNANLTPTNVTINAGSPTGDGVIGGVVTLSAAAATARTTSGTGGTGGTNTIKSGTGGDSLIAGSFNTGGVGGPVNITAGNAGAVSNGTSATYGGVGGAINITAGNGGSVSAAGGYTPTGPTGGALTIRSGDGGLILNPVLGAGNFSGAGGQMSLITGAGSSGVAADVIGGTGGQLGITCGNGGAAGTNRTGGLGGGFYFLTGVGGTSAQSGAGTNTGGGGGSMQNFCSAGGQAQGGSVSNIGGVGGWFQFSGGNGGAASTPGAKGGNGGYGGLVGGNAGTGGNADGGYLFLTPGLATGGGQVGYVLQAATTAGVLRGDVRVGTTNAPATGVTFSVGQSASVTSNLTVGLTNTVGYFVGNGGGLTNIPTNAITGLNLAITNVVNGMTNGLGGGSSGNILTNGVSIFTFKVISYDTNVTYGYATLTASGGGSTGGNLPYYAAGTNFWTNGTTWQLIGGYDCIGKNYNMLSNSLVYYDRESDTPVGGWSTNSPCGLMQGIYPAPTVTATGATTNYVITTNITWMPTNYVSASLTSIHFEANELGGSLYTNVIIQLIAPTTMFLIVSPANITLGQDCTGTAQVSPQLEYTDGFGGYHLADTMGNGTEAYGGLVNYTTYSLGTSGSAYADRTWLALELPSFSIFIKGGTTVTWRLLTTDYNYGDAFTQAASVAFSSQ